MSTILIVIFIIAILTAFILGAYAFRMGARMSFYSEKGYYPPPDRKVSVKPEIEEEKSDKGKKEKAWDDEV